MPAIVLSVFLFHDPMNFNMALGLTIALFFAYLYALEIQRASDEKDGASGGGAGRFVRSLAFGRDCRDLKRLWFYADGHLRLLANCRYGTRMANSLPSLPPPRPAAINKLPYCTHNW